MPATSSTDGGTYDFDPDGLGATIVDDRPGQLGSPTIGIDVVIECEPEEAEVVG